MNIVSDVDLKIIKRIPFSSVDFVFDALHDAFHPNGVDDEEGPDAKFLALWNIFLHTVGWTEDEYWKSLEEYRNTHCADCGKILPPDENKDDPKDKPN